ncbi:MAG: MoaD/ThiS family protein [Planctomycetes bacterium]|nr:MoaD/ThiS family protein [Planctomycetota bacterium]
MPSPKVSEITVEFYGMPRARAGRKEIHVSAATIGEALAAIVEACPALKDLRQPDGRLAPHYLLSVDGEPFVVDTTQALKAGDRLLLLWADVGG